MIYCKQENALLVLTEMGSAVKSCHLYFYANTTYSYMYCRLDSQTLHKLLFNILDK